MNLRSLVSKIPAAGLAEQELREAASEFGAVTEVVAQGLRAHYNLGRDEYIWPRMMYADRVVVLVKGKLYQHPYTIADDNTAKLGDAVEVTLEPTPVRSASTASMTEARATDTGWFVEAKSDGADDQAVRYLVRVIRSGVSLNGVDYPAKVLRESVQKFEGVRVFAKPDDVHVRGGGKDIERLVGKLSNARFVETGKDAGEIHADMDVLRTSPIYERLREAVERGMTDLFGLSIDAIGKSKSNGKFREAQSITRVVSVDLIIEPGAGGQILRFTEAQQEPDTMLRQQMIDTVRRRDPARADQLANASDNDVLEAYREAVAADASDAARSAAQGGGTQLREAVNRDDMQQQFRLVEARAEMRAQIGGAKLPDAAKARLVERFLEATDPAALARDKVQAAIDDELAYGRHFRESAAVRGLGDAAYAAGETESVSQATGRMLDDFFSGKASISFREAYIQITGDWHISGNFRECDPTRLAEAAGEKYREAINAGTFADILGDSITRAMLREYTADARFQDWRDLVDIVPVRDFRSQERVQIGGYGDLPAVAQSGPYAALTTPGDDKATYTITKRGGTERITLEAIANDDVGLIRRIPQKLGRAASRTLYKFVLDFLATNPLIYDGLALFVGGHNNLGTAALSAASFAAARLRMQLQAEPGSSERLGLVLSHLYVPSNLEEAAFDLFVRGTNNDETFVQSRKPRVHVVPYWTDVNNWFATADKGDIPLIELGFFNGQEMPELFVQDSPNQGRLFSNDEIEWKIRHIYGGAVLDFRGFDGSIVA